MNTNTALIAVSVISVLSPVVANIVNYYIQRDKLSHSKEMFVLKSEASQYEESIKYIQNIFEDYLTTTLKYIQLNRPLDMKSAQSKAELLAVMYASSEDSTTILNLSLLLNDDKFNSNKAAELDMLLHTVAPAINKQVTSNKSQL